MTTYIDVHRRVEGATSADAADAHRADLQEQWRFGVRFQGFWFASATRTLFCLVEGPDVDTVQAVHRASHGLVADEIYQVDGGLDENVRRPRTPNQS